MKKILNKIDDDLEIIFPNDKPEIEDLKREFKIKDQAVSEKKAELEKKLMTAKTKLEHENHSVQKMNEDIKSGESRIQRFNKKLGTLTSIDTFDTNLEAAKAEVNAIRDELQIKEANKHTFKQFVEKWRNP